MFKHLKDPFSGLSHLIGAILSLVGGLALVIPLYHRGEMVKAYSFAAFGAGLILLYSASAAYHLAILNTKGNTILRRIDHMMIYILIAATYTPICLIALPRVWGWSLFGVIWAMALGGVILTLFVINKPRWATVAIYLVMGWSPPASRPAHRHLLDRPRRRILLARRNRLCPQTTRPLSRCIRFPRSVAPLCYGRQPVSLPGDVYHNPVSINKFNLPTQTTQNAIHILSSSGFGAARQIRAQFIGSRCGQPGA